MESLLLGKHRRRYERRADAFAAWLTNDKELVVRPLTKMTYINQSPGKLKPSDEALSHHPSFVNRIQALQELDLSIYNPLAEPLLGPRDAEKKRACPPISRPLAKSATDASNWP